MPACLYVHPGSPFYKTGLIKLLEQVVNLRLTALGNLPKILLLLSDRGWDRNLGLNSTRACIVPTPGLSRVFCLLRHFSSRDSIISLGGQKEGPCDKVLKAGLKRKGEWDYNIIWDWSELYLGSCCSEPQDTFTVDSAQVLPFASSPSSFSLYRPHSPIFPSVALFSTDLSLSVACVVAGPALVVIVMIARHPSAITIRKLWKVTILLCTRPGYHRARLGPHSKVLEGERVSTWAWGRAFIEEEDGDLQEEKTNIHLMQWWGTGSGQRWLGSLGLYLVLWLEMCSLKSEHHLRSGCLGN